MRDSVAVHVPCSSKKLKLNDQMIELAERCAPARWLSPLYTHAHAAEVACQRLQPHASQVLTNPMCVYPLQHPYVCGHRCAHEVAATPIPCCGMAGDRGMRYPELTGSSLQHLDLPSSCSDGKLTRTLTRTLEP